MPNLINSYSLPSVNVTDISKKPILTDSQINTLKVFYSDDVELYQKVSVN